MLRPPHPQGAFTTVSPPTCVAPPHARGAFFRLSAHRKDARPRSQRGGSYGPGTAGRQSRCAVPVPRPGSARPPCERERHGNASGVLSAYLSATDSLVLCHARGYAPKTFYLAYLTCFYRLMRVMFRIFSQERRHSPTGRIAFQRKATKRASQCRHISYSTFWMQNKGHGTVC